MKRGTKKTWKQLGGLLLTLVMLLTLLPVGALAEEETLPAQDGQTVDGTETPPENEPEVPSGDGEAAPAPDSTQEPAPESTETPDTGAASDPDDTAAPTPAQQVQALIDALPDPESITAETRADVEAQLAAIDQAKLALGDGELDGLDVARYMAAAAALLALDGMAGADGPEAMAFPGDLSGSGIASDPYQISTAEQLAQLSQYVNGGQDCQDTYFALTGNIDLGGGAWTPIGGSTYFKGTFDGGGHTVSGLSVTSGDNRGLFGRIGTEGAVKNLGVSGDINGGGSNDAGGVAGYSQGTITGCHSACTVDNGGYTGGIVGENRGTVEDCYNVGGVRGSDAGGIVGYNQPRRTVTNCYSTGQVSSSSSAGGIVGRNNGGSVTNCYYLENTASTGVGSRNGSVTETKVEPRSEDDFRHLASTLGDGWADDPFLGRPVLKDSREPSPVAGQGTAEAPYLIPDKATLEMVRDYINRDSGHGKDQFFKLTENIDFGGEEWTPIGSGYVNPFRGTFDGDGYTISGLSVNTSDSAGLFGVVYNGHIKNLGVSGTVTSSDRAAGGIVGEMGDYDAMEGSITNCHSSVTVTGSGYVGGIVGQNYGNRISDCYNTGVLSNDSSHTGGIAGANFGGVLENCYNTGAVSGESRVGGITGINEGRYGKPAEISNCYNIGTVSGNRSVGGIVGENLYSVKNCYYSYACGAGGEGTEKTADQFASGEVAWLLQKDQGSQVWGQTVGGGAPELTGSAEKTVYQITGKVEGQADVVWYSNSKATLPAAPLKAGFAFDGWSKTDGGSVDFAAGATVGGDMTVYAVFTDKRLDGTGSVTMADYTCGDDSVEPVAESATNGTADVTFTYAVRGQDDFSAAKPTAAGEYTVKAVFAATDDYHEVTATADFKVTHQFNAGWEQREDGYHHTCACGAELLLKTEALTAVPTGLASAYPSVEALTQALVKQLSTGSDYAVYDVTLKLHEAGGEWRDAAPADFPAKGVAVTVPYPEGASASDTFTVVHMFAAGANAGKTETLAVTKGTDGITFTVKSLSPVCIGWKVLAKPAPTNTPVGTAPYTGDDSQPALWLAVLGLALVGLAAAGGGTLTGRKGRRQRR